MSDDHTSQAWGIYDEIFKDYARTPNIRRLAGEGATLTRVFCTNSICVPSRASIMTGRYSHQNGIYTLSEGLHPDSNNVAKELQKGGYQTALVGKWHLKQRPAGFDYYEVLPGQGRYNNPILRDESNWPDGKEFQGFSSDVIGDLAVDWLDQRNKEEPFFLMCHFKATHEPFDYPARYDSMYADVTMPEPASLYDFGEETNGRTFIGQKMDILGNRYTRDTLGERYPGMPFSLEGLDRIQARSKVYQKFVKDFLRSGAAIDDNIGKLLDHLDQEGLRENTVVIYCADQGYFLGEHGFFDKRMIYEEAIQMPFIIRYPAEIEAGLTNHDMILNLDFPSLFLDYGGVSIPSYMKGVSFRDNLKGNTPTDWRNDLYYRYWLHLEVRPAHLGIRNDRYKLALFYGHPLDMPGSDSTPTLPAWEFYDLEKDPHEGHNAYGDAAYQDIIRYMKGRLLELKHQVGDNDTTVDIDSLISLSMQ